MAAILRARVRRAISGLISLSSKALALIAEAFGLNAWQLLKF